MDSISFIFRGVETRLRKLNNLGQVISSTVSIWTEGYLEPKPTLIP